MFQNYAFTRDFLLMVHMVGARVFFPQTFGKVFVCLVDISPGDAAACLLTNLRSPALGVNG